MSKNRSKEQAKRRLKRVEAQRICRALNAKKRRRVPGEATYTDKYYVGQDYSIKRTRVTSRPRRPIDETKLALAFWLMAKRHVEKKESKHKHNID